MCLWDGVISSGETEYLFFGKEWSRQLGTFSVHEFLDAFDRDITCNLFTQICVLLQGAHSFSKTCYTKLKEKKHTEEYLPPKCYGPLRYGL